MSSKVRSTIIMCLIGSSDFINKLWNAEENQDVVKKFLNNRLCKICAENKDPNALELFQTYAVVRIVSPTPCSMKF